jgi:phosphoglycerol transferase MdoB-like AlkP superfamily enzyme
MDSITPNFNRLVHEGVLFSNIYANGDRSDKGIVAVLSGFPAFPQKSIIKYPNKTQQLPFISKDFNSLGYQTAFYYGGDIDFASMRSYFITGGFNSIVSKDDFDKKYHKSKWGVHDHLVFDRLYEDINSVKEPFFYSYFTLSSHEPFEVPMETVIKGNSNEAMYLNSANYTDKCLGEFIEKAKTQPWWDNTLVVCIADHGIRHPGNTGYNRKDKYRIPMLWLGGALNTKDTVVDKYGTQTDFVSTLLGQMDIENSEYIYSKNLLDSASNSFSYYVFNNGFSFITDTSMVLYDNVSGKILKQYGEVDLDKGKSLLQTSFQDFLDK